MALAHYQGTVTNESGDVEAGASVEVRQEGALARLAPIKATSGGAPKVNPITADTSGYFDFWAEPGWYRIKASKVIGAETWTREWTYVCIGEPYDREHSVYGGTPLYFDDGTADADPGDGAIRFNHATHASATFAYVDDLNIYGSSIVDLVNGFDATGGTNHKGTLRFEAAIDRSIWREYVITGNITDAAGYLKIPVSHVASAGDIGLGDALVMLFTPAGPGKAAEITNTPAGDIAATTVQGAINELDTEKVAKAGDTMTGPLTLHADPSSALHAATKAYVDQIIAAQDAMVFKGAINASTNPSWPAADRGHTYRISVAGRMGGASGPVVEAGDLVICTTDGTPGGNNATVGANWVISQTNIDGAVVGPASATDNAIARFDATTGKLIQNSGVTLGDDGSLQFPTANGDKIRFYSTSYGIGNEDFTLTRWATSRHRWRIGGAGVAAGTARMELEDGKLALLGIKLEQAGNVALDTADIGVSVQGYDADLAAIADLSTQAYGRSLLTISALSGLQTALAIPTSTTDERLVRHDGTSGGQQSSAIAVNDSGDMLGVRNLTMAGALALAGDISPAALSANVDNYNPAGLATAAHIRQDASTHVQISGLAGGADGRVIILHNISSSNIVLEHEGSNSSAANRFALGASIALLSGQSIMLTYDATAQRWRAVGGTGSGSGGGLDDGDYGDVIVSGGGTIMELDPDTVAAIRAGWDFDSGEIAVASTGLSVEHGLGQAPSKVQLILRCKTAQHGWAIDDELVMSGYDAPGANGQTIGVSATHVYWSGYGPRINNKSTGSFAGAVTAGNWRWVVRASI